MFHERIYLMWMLLLLLTMEQIHIPLNKSVKSCLIHLQDCHFRQYQPKRPVVFKAKFRYAINYCKQVLKYAKLACANKARKTFCRSLSDETSFWKMSFYEIAAAGQGVKHLEALGNFQFLVLVAVYFLKQISFLSSLLLWFLSYSFTGRNK